jgi:hypothetical protein
MAYRYPLVLYSQHNSALHHYDNPVIHTVCTFGILVGPNNQGWLLLAQLHRGRPDHGCLVCKHGLCSCSPSYVTLLRNDFEDDTDSN